MSTVKLSIMLSLVELLARLLLVLRNRFRHVHSRLDDIIQRHGAMGLLAAHPSVYCLLSY